MLREVKVRVRSDNGKFKQVVGKAIQIKNMKKGEDDVFIYA